MKRLIGHSLIIRNDCLPWYDFVVFVGFSFFSFSFFPPLTISNAHDFHPGIATAAHSTIHFDGVFLQPLVLRNNDPTTQSGQGHKENLMGSWAGSWLAGLALKLPGPSWATEKR